MCMEFKLCTQEEAHTRGHVTLQDGHIRNMPCRAHIQWGMQHELTAIRTLDLLLSAGHLVNTL